MANGLNDFGGDEDRLDIPEQEFSPDNPNTPSVDNEYNLPPETYSAPPVNSEDDDVEKTTTRNKIILTAIGTAVGGALIFGGAGFAIGHNNSDNGDGTVTPGGTVTQTAAPETVTDTTQLKEKDASIKKLNDTNKKLKSDNDKYRDDVKDLRSSNSKLREEAKKPAKTVTKTAAPKTVTKTETKEVPANISREDQNKINNYDKVDKARETAEQKLPKNPSKDKTYKWDGSKFTEYTLQTTPPNTPDK